MSPQRQIQPISISFHEFKRLKIKRMIEEDEFFVLYGTGTKTPDIVLFMLLVCMTNIWQFILGFH